MAGDEQWAEPVEIVDGDESTTEVEGGRSVDWHRMARTGAAVVAALSLLWIGRSMADERARAAQQACQSELQNAYYFYEQASYRSPGGRSGEGGLPDELLADLADRARDCGASDVWADALEYEFPTEDDD